MSFLISANKESCFGCEACIQACHKKALSMQEDHEGFRYPVINKDLCINCGMCKKVCPHLSLPDKNRTKQYVFGGFIKNKKVREESTSGGFFSAIVKVWSELHPNNYVIFGAEAEKLRVFHSFITNIKDLQKYRKSKYSQSEIGESYLQTKEFLKQGKYVLFSGTPCQIAGLMKYLQNTNTENLLTIEVICEGVPSPLFIRKYNEYCEKIYNSPIKSLDYRYKDNKKWDFEVMYTLLENLHHFKIDRWFNPFWSIWLSHLMSRPSCYKCLFTTKERIADITLGDLWGVHIYCPELYGHNGGSSLAICNSPKGQKVFKQTESELYGHILDLDTAIKYQSPLRKSIDYNPQRSQFLEDCKQLEYGELINKWARKPSIRLLFQKYIWGNRQKMLFLNLKKRIKVYR